VTAKAEQYRDSFGRFTISTVTVMEIVKGLHKMSRRQRLGSFLEAIEADEILGLDLASAELAGRIHGDLERTGQTIGRADPMIAAIAMSHDLALATGNTEHLSAFARWAIRSVSKTGAPDKPYCSTNRR
jgi:tRNA(fMet)-specific endonuclease VapC